MPREDVGKVTRIDTGRLEAKGVIDTGFITNHLGFAKTAEGTLAYVTVGGENAVKVYTTGDTPKLIARVPAGQAPQALVYVSNAAPDGSGSAWSMQWRCRCSS